MGQVLCIGEIRTDLAFSTDDRLLQEVRKKLRVRHGFERGGEPFGVECVHSRERPVHPGEEQKMDSTGDAEGADLRLDCATGFGTASFVTGVFGMVAASRVVHRLALDQGKA